MALDILVKYWEPVCVSQCIQQIEFAITKLQRSLLEHLTIIPLCSKVIEK